MYLRWVESSWELRYSTSFRLTLGKNNFQLGNKRLVNNNCIASFSYPEKQLRRLIEVETGSCLSGEAHSSPGRRLPNCCCENEIRFQEISLSWVIDKTVILRLSEHDIITSCWRTPDLRHVFSTIISDVSPNKQFFCIKNSFKIEHFLRIIAMRSELEDKCKVNNVYVLSRNCSFSHVVKQKSQAEGKALWMIT